MMDGKPSRALPFVSLKWKFVIALIVMMTVLSVLLGRLALDRFEQQRAIMLEQKVAFIRQDYQQTLAHVERRLLVIASELSHTHSVSADASIQTQIEQHWRDSQQDWGLVGLSLYDVQGNIAFRLGAHPLPADNWLAQLQTEGQHLWRQRCRQACVMDLATTVRIESQSYLLVLVAPLMEVLSTLNQNHNVELAVLGQAHPSTLNPWGRTILSLTNRDTNYRTLIAASRNSSFEQFSESPAQLALGTNNWSFFSWPLDDFHQLLLFFDSSGMDESQRVYFNDLVLFTLVSVLGTTFIFSLLFWPPLARVQQLQKLLPLMARGEYGQIIDKIHKPRWGFVDEVDKLEWATESTVKQLQKLHEEVDRYTHELERLAMMDTLTGLPNRTMMHHELSKSLSSLGRTDEKIALLFLDLDEFKRINDTLGHDVGDELLKTVANRLKKSVRSMDTVCRLGGDEFTVIVRGLGEGSNIHRIIHQIFVSLQQPVQLGRHTLIVTTSIGVVFCDNPMLRPEELLKRADLAMYQAKQAGRSNYRVFDEQMLELASRKLMLEADLRVALEEGQISVSLQPIVSIKDQKVVGFESLVRWYHPSRGLLMPTEFIRDLEGSNELLTLSDWVLKKSLNLMQKLTKISGTQDFYVAVNLSPHQYLHSGLGERIESLLNDLQVPPSRLLLELTEESLIKNLDQALSTMERLKGMGVKVAIDDFGTGYSSLSYLKQLPFDILKIDRSFVRDLDSSDVDRNIVNSVIDLAHNLNRSVIAEGVESHDQLQYLMKAGCDYAQGYLYSPALDEQQAVELIRQLGPDLNWARIESIQSIFHPLSGNRS